MLRFRHSFRGVLRRVRSASSGTKSRLGLVVVLGGIAGFSECVSGITGLGDGLRLSMEWMSGSHNAAAQQQHDDVKAHNATPQHQVGKSQTTIITVHGPEDDFQSFSPDYALTAAHLSNAVYEIDQGVEGSASLRYLQQNGICFQDKFGPTEDRDNEMMLEWAVYTDPHTVYIVFRGTAEPIDFIIDIAPGCSPHRDIYHHPRNCVSVGERGDSTRERHRPFLYRSGMIDAVEDYNTEDEKGGLAAYGPIGLICKVIAAHRSPRNSSLESNIQTEHSRERKNLVLCGHSLGGAYAYIVGAIFAESERYKHVREMFREPTVDGEEKFNIFIRTFGAPPSMFVSYPSYSASPSDLAEQTQLDHIKLPSVRRLQSWTHHYVNENDPFARVAEETWITHAFPRVFEALIAEAVSAVVQDSVGYYLGYLPLGTSGVRAMGQWIGGTIGSSVMAGFLERFESYVKVHMSLLVRYNSYGTMVFMEDSKADDNLNVLLTNRGPHNPAGHLHGAHRTIEYIVYGDHQQGRKAEPQSVKDDWADLDNTAVIEFPPTTVENIINDHSMISYIPRIERIDKWRSGSIKNGKRVCVIPVEEGKFVEAEVCGFSDGVLHFYTPRAGRLHLQTVKEDGSVAAAQGSIAVNCGSSGGIVKVRLPYHPGDECKSVRARFCSSPE
ncbi:hypothetical protein AAMO2058_001320200 [Amorphochlora amoebiformis]